jgi:hypothetical protein
MGGQSHGGSHPGDELRSSSGVLLLAELHQAGPAGGPPGALPVVRHDTLHLHLHGAPAGGRAGDLQPPTGVQVWGGRKAGMPRGWASRARQQVQCREVLPLLLLLLLLLLL